MQCWGRIVRYLISQTAPRVFNIHTSVFFFLSRMLVLHLFYLSTFNIELAPIAYFLQVHPLFPPSPVLTCLEMAVEMWISLWAGHWGMETVLISTSSTLPPRLPRSHMGDLWTSLVPVLHSMNLLVFRQIISITLQCMVSTVGIRRGVKVSPWQSLLKVCAALTDNFVAFQQIYNGINFKRQSSFCKLGNIDAVLSNVDISCTIVNPLIWYLQYIYIFAF